MSYKHLKFETDRQTNLPRRQIFAEKRERAHKPLVDVVQWQLFRRRVQYRLRRIQQHTGNR